MIMFAPGIMSFFFIFLFILRKRYKASEWNESEQVELDNVTQQKVMETIINIRRKNLRLDTDTIY